MYLKSIEIHGFKSFANKITFQFHNGITGIVGPNGSGKSNVADAVRWVLGEQRIKQLRGASMQDVIFSGTEIRKPLGYAYVAITLDNRDHQLAVDFDEVTVARRIYRSGESEYLMNGSPVRLKDVNELFYDTGIGKEGYSIIGQGQIDKILSGKPEERRELFDEAAGIVKFKRRKSAAQKKLEDEKQNLLRVSDILSELEKQVEPLEKQSEKARIYLKKKEQLKDLDVNVFLLENARLKDQLAGVKEKYEIASGDLQETTSKYEHIKEEYEQVQAEIEQLDKQIEEERSQLTDTGMLRGKLEGEINVLKEQINSVRGNENHLLSRQENLQREIEARSRNEAAILEDKAEVDAHLSQLEEAREEAKAELARVQAQIDELNANIENGKNSIITALNERATIKSRMGRFDTMLEQIQIRRAELNSRLLRAKSDEAQQEDLIRKLEEEFLRINDNISEFNDRQSVLVEELNQIRDELSQKDQKLRDTQVVYHQDKSRLDALSNLTERYEGYGGSVKRVMERKSSNSGIIGVVADLIKVEKKYEVAIETALGGSIQNIVTETEETAKEMIAFLKQNKAGRATFLPLTSIRNRQEFRMKEVLSEPGVLGLADTLVNTEERYRDVAASLLGRIVVVDNVDNAVRIARKYKYSLRMVTLEGELFNPGGSISGGAYKNNSNLLGRRREMAELETKVRETLKSIDILLDDIEKTKQRRNKLRMELEQTKASLQEEFIHQNTARMNVAAAREKKEQTEQGYGDLQNEQREIASQIEEIQNGKEEIRRELEASELLEKDVDSRIHMAQKELEERKEEENLHSSRVSEWDLEVEKIRQKQGFEQTNLDRIRGDIQKFTEELKEIEEGMEAGRQEIARKEADILALQETINASYTNQNSGEEKLKADMERKEVLAGRQKNFFADRESLAERLSGLDKEVYRLSAQQEKLEESVEAQINYMWDEYEITLSDAAALKNEELQDLTAMKKEITSLKDQIRRLGDVNVNAIEDYKNLMERYTFLKNQHDDLIKAEETLKGIILELDEAMRKQFREKFAQISQEFDKVFKELFGGGKGTLELMEDEDILEAGIRIIAQPPGKKLQNMMQLSGGEKALTAISLLFAIQNLKPSPFCLLDEIEAALDDSNVGRFANYLHKLTKYTQFIVITHRRGTMEKADRLYGITMQEKGVSTLVSVSLIEKEIEN
ncbi:chromosome segregation protein SMC [Eisenbergiella tayi]|uniref:Chromosome partition protein Smc n=1 Tax=Eisenbergiella tayi TaxID=1432052 RepID=A0A1E3A2H7_9FIRM|nr:chromosome segregation protein SMC [Eisenbergiella tayi]ODM02973.1 Chromosome partition protein Smc [Eisenbergiella tayi]